MLTNQNMPMERVDAFGRVLRAESRSRSRSPASSRRRRRSYSSPRRRSRSRSYDRRSPHHHHRRSRSASRDSFRDPLEAEIPLSCAQHAQILHAHTLPSVHAEDYLLYKAAYNKLNQERFLEQHQRDPWFLESYSPEHALPWPVVQDPSAFAQAAAAELLELFRKLRARLPFSEDGLVPREPAPDLEPHRIPLPEGVESSSVFDIPEKLLIRVGPIPVSCPMKEILELAESLPGFRRLMPGRASTAQDLRRFAWLEFADAGSAEEALLRVENASTASWSRPAARPVTRPLCQRTAPEFCALELRAEIDLALALRLMRALDRLRGVARNFLLEELEEPAAEAEGFPRLPAEELREQALRKLAREDVEPRSRLARAAPMLGRLNLVLEYLRRVHLFCFYCDEQFASPEELLGTCGQWHGRQQNRWSRGEPPAQLAAPAAPGESLMAWIDRGVRKALQRPSASSSASSSAGSEQGREPEQEQERARDDARDHARLQHLEALLPEERTQALLEELFQLQLKGLAHAVLSHPWGARRAALAERWFERLESPPSSKNSDRGAPASQPAPRASSSSSSSSEPEDGAMQLEEEEDAGPRDPLLELLRERGAGFAGSEAHARALAELQDAAQAPMLARFTVLKLRRKNPKDPESPELECKRCTLCRKVFESDFFVGKHLRNLHAEEVEPFLAQAAQDLQRELFLRDSAAPGFAPSDRELPDARHPMHSLSRVMGSCAPFRRFVSAGETPLKKQRGHTPMALAPVRFEPLPPIRYVDVDSVSSASAAPAASSIDYGLPTDLVIEE